MQKKWDTRVMVEIAVAAALALILGMLRLYRMAYGGSITLEMVPLFVISLRHGVRAGMWSGFIAGILNLFLDPYIIHPIQLVMDYPLPFAALGLAGLFPNRPMIGLVLGTAGRYVIHVLSGAIFFGAYAPEGMNPWIYSLGYNASYIVPNGIIAIVVIGLLLQTPLLKTDKSRGRGR
ncbi:MAG: energy-coupled thiamine transporter ThiT [Firmicutes bacterium]|jgi:thiamine transporter|nr:energy-coupled thiamine transporter ThiT [Bacillota bacterium]